MKGKNGYLLIQLDVKEGQHPGGVGDGEHVRGAGLPREIHDAAPRARQPEHWLRLKRKRKVRKCART